MTELVQRADAWIQTVAHHHDRHAEHAAEDQGEGQGQPGPGPDRAPRGLGRVDDLRGQAAVIADETRLLELLDDRVEQQSLPFQLVAQVVIGQQIELELLGLFLVLVILLAELVPHDLYGLEALLECAEQVTDLAYLHVAPRATDALSDPLNLGLQLPDLGVIRPEPLVELLVLLSQLSNVIGRAVL